MNPSNEYYSALHALQSAIKFEQEMLGSEGITAREFQLNNTLSQVSKNLRVGVNSALVNDKVLVDLLILKGIITEEEYLDQLTIEMKNEVQRYIIKFKEKGFNNISFA